MLNSKDYKGVGVAFEITSPLNQPKFVQTTMGSIGFVKQTKYFQKVAMSYRISIFIE